MSSLSNSARRRWLAPEIVQTSSMDCGPAALACLVQGFHLSVNFDRLREACQTDVDGTSIDEIEKVANQLGVKAEQVMVPVDHLGLSEAHLVPSIVVVRLADSATHFVVVWRQLGPWLQIMDPSIGRRWVLKKNFFKEVFRHRMVVSAKQWRAWAATEDFLNPMRQLMAQLGVDEALTEQLISKALSDPLWYGAAALDASVRFVKSMLDAGGMTAGAQTSKLVKVLFEHTLKKAQGVFRIIPKNYWTVTADQLDASDESELTLHGAVLLRVQGVATATQKANAQSESQAVSPEIKAAQIQKTISPFQHVRDFLKLDGLRTMVLLGVAVAVAAAVVVVETLLFRGLFDIAGILNEPNQRMGALLGLMALIALLILIEFPIASETMRLGRHLEVRLRMALLEKLPLLSDRYLQSRPVSDMAERSHSIYLTRAIPSYLLRFLQLVFDLAFTLLGILLIDPQAIGWALLLIAMAIVIPLMVQPFLNERDLRVRNHSGALQVFYLDALLGQIPIRTHGAERSVRRQHEGLLVEWVRSIRGLNGVTISSGAIQSLICVGIAAWLLFQHFERSGIANGSDLLLIYWALKLPSLGGSLATMATQYPMQRNILLRLFEPLSVPLEPVAPAKPRSASKPSNPGGLAIEVRRGQVIASGHPLLQGLDLKITAGEHVAIVGSSGAGKSTLLGLLQGWHRLAQGELRLDGSLVSPSNIASYRRETAWVDPAIQLWNKSFQDNLTYAAQREQLDNIGAALEVASLRKVLQQLPEGLQTWLGEGGALLSGGEGQRVRFARALLQSDIRLALLDEPFRGLDRSMRIKLLNEARRWWRDATLLCVTHDVTETTSFNRVLVIEDGHIVEDGAPAQLAQRTSRYRELLDAEAQLKMRFWMDPQWRHLRLDNGQISEMPGAVKSAWEVQP